MTRVEQRAAPLYGDNVRDGTISQKKCFT